MARLRFAIYWAAGCGGCDIAVLDLHERLLDVAALADLVFWPIALDFKLKDVEAFPDGHVSVCLFNGAIRNAENAHVARLLRRKSQTLVAFGACAHLGGVPGLANLTTVADLVRTVYSDSPSTVNPDGTVPLERSSVAAGELTLPRLLPEALPLDQVVPVDYYVPGCPPAVERVWEVLLAIAEGKLPERGAVLGAGRTSLCDECKRAKGEKRIKEFRSVATFTPDPERCLLEQGVICCGPATRGGCGAQCLGANMPCRGCYGPPDGVRDQGAQLLSSIASAIDSQDPAEVERIAGQVEDPVGTFYRFSLPSLALRRAPRVEAP